MTDGKRYLVLIDLLGFRSLVASKPASQLYDMLDRSLEVFRRWENLNGGFHTIHFSDTFLFYQRSPGYHSSAFLDAYAIGGMLLCALLAEGIPARGAVSCGEFVVRPDTSGRHSIFFGQALIDAYLAEKSRNWIGITVLPSAWQPYESANPGAIDVFAAERTWERTDSGALLLNPFRRMSSHYTDDQLGEISTPYMAWDAPEFPNEIRAYKFLHDELDWRAAQANPDDTVTTKYRTTVEFVRRILGADVYDWGRMLAQGVDP